MIPRPASVGRVFRFPERHIPDAPARQATGRAPLPQANVHMMIQRRALAAGIRTKISAHSFRATGITTYLQNGGKLRVAQQIGSPRPQPRNMMDPSWPKRIEFGHGWGRSEMTAKYPLTLPRSDTDILAIIINSGRH